MELRKQNEREKPGQVTAASWWCKKAYIKWVTRALLYIWLWKRDSFSAWDSSVFSVSGLHVCTKISEILLGLTGQSGINPCDQFPVCLRCNICCILTDWDSEKAAFHMAIKVQVISAMYSHFNGLNPFAVWTIYKWIMLDHLTVLTSTASLSLIYWILQNWSTYRLW